MADRFLEDYVPVAERLELFRKDHPEWTLSSHLVADDGQRVLMKASVADETGRVVATGYAEEIRGSGPVNRTSAVENAETSAWGRALANLGYEVRRGVASAEEMGKAARQPAQASQTAPEGPVLPQKRLLGRAAREAGFGGEENREARRDVLQAATGKRNPDDLTPMEVKAALDAYEDLKAKTVEFGYDEDGIPTLTQLESR